MITGGGFWGGPSSGSGSGGGEVQPESPPRDPAKGKDTVVAEEASGEVLVGPVEFRPAAESSGIGPSHEATLQSTWTRGCSPACYRRTPQWLRRFWQREKRDRGQ